MWRQIDASHRSEFGRLGKLAVAHRRNALQAAIRVPAAVAPLGQLAIPLCLQDGMHEGKKRRVLGVVTMHRC